MYFLISIEVKTCTVTIVALIYYRLQHIAHFLQFPIRKIIYKSGKPLKALLVLHLIKLIRYYSVSRRGVSKFSYECFIRVV